MQFGLCGGLGHNVVFQTLGYPEIASARAFLGKEGVNYEPLRLLHVLNVITSRTAVNSCYCCFRHCNFLYFNHSPSSKRDSIEQIVPRTAQQLFDFFDHFDAGYGLGTFYHLKMGPAYSGSGREAFLSQPLLHAETVYVLSEDAGNHSEARYKLHSP